MTSDQAFKQKIRARMAATGERYTTARLALLQGAADRPTSVAGKPAGATGYLHLGGVHPELAALRVSLANIGVVDPTTGQPLSEALLYGLCGGLATGVMALHYAEADHSTLWLTGWNPFGNSIQLGCDHLGIAVDQRETGGAKSAAGHLDELLGVGAPIIAWVDEATLGHSGMPASFAGGSYHTISVYGVDDTSAWIGDRGPEPVAVDKNVLAAARGRIRKDKHRIISLGTDEVELDLPTAIDQALHHEVDGAQAGPAGTFSLRALDRLAGRVHDDSTKDGWARVFPRGPHLWSALRELYRCVEHGGSGGGLSRGRYADYLDHAAEATGREPLRELAGVYRDLASRWTALAATPLLAHPLLQATRDAVDATIQPLEQGRPDAASITASAWTELDRIHEHILADGFPITVEETDELLGTLQQALTDVTTREHRTAEQRARIITGS